MSATLNETKEQEKFRLLQELYEAEGLYAAARRMEKWDIAHSYSEDVSRLTRLINLNAQEP